MSSYRHQKKYSAPHAIAAYLAILAALRRACMVYLLAGLNRDDDRVTGRDKIFQRCLQPRLNGGDCDEGLRHADCFLNYKGQPKCAHVFILT